MDPIAVRAERLAELLDCSVGKVRAMTPDLPHYRHQGVVLYPVDAVRKHLNEKSFETLEANRRKGVR